MRHAFRVESSTIARDREPDITSIRLVAARLLGVLAHGTFRRPLKRRIVEPDEAVEGSRG